MAKAFRPTIAVDVGSAVENRLPGLYLGIVLIINCAACLPPVEFFIFAIAPRHGLLSLVLFGALLIGGSLLVLLLPDSYYRIRSFESSGRVYERLGIRFFKRLVPNGDYINRLTRRFDAGYRVVSDTGSIAKFEAQTRAAEICHLAWLFMALPPTAYALLLGWHKFALWIFLPNVPFNLYPVLLQRYTRARINRVLKRRKHKS